MCLAVPIYPAYTLLNHNFQHGAKMENKKLTVPAMLLGLSVALGPTLAGYFIYKGITDFKMADRYVTVKGLVEKIVKSDSVTWSLNTRNAGNDLAVLYQ